VNLGTQKHRDKYLDGISNLTYLGCFAMTELHHGMCAKFFSYRNVRVCQLLFLRLLQLVSIWIVPSLEVD